MPPYKSAELFENAQPATVSEPALKTPPPYALATLLERVQLVRVSVPDC